MKDEYLALWYRALEAEIGIAVQCNAPNDLAKRMYAVRKDIADPRLQELTIQQPGDGNELWICHKSTEIPS